MIQDGKFVGSMLRLESQCHPDTPSNIMLTPGRVYLACSKCEAHIVCFALQDGIYENIVTSQGKSLKTFKDGFILSEVIATLDDNECMVIECGCCREEMFIVPLKPGTVTKEERI